MILRLPGWQICPADTLPTVTVSLMTGSYRKQGRNHMLEEQIKEAIKILSETRDTELCEELIRTH